MGAITGQMTNIDPASGAKAFKWPDFESWKMQSWQPQDISLYMI